MATKKSKKESNPIDNKPKRPVGRPATRHLEGETKRIGANIPVADHAAFRVKSFNKGVELQEVLKAMIRLYNTGEIDDKLDRVL